MLNKQTRTWLGLRLVPYIEVTTEDYSSSLHNLYLKTSLLVVSSFFCGNKPLTAEIFISNKNIFRPNDQDLIIINLKNKTYHQMH